MELLAGLTDKLNELATISGATPEAVVAFADVLTDSSPMTATQALDAMRRRVCAGDDLRAAARGVFYTFPATWRRDEPFLDGMARFRIAIRSIFDPEPLTREERRAQKKGFEAWRRDLFGEAEDWRREIVELLEDGDSRTFNRIMLDLTGRVYTADQALGKPPEDGLWLAVRRSEVYWSDLADGACWFARAHGAS